ncbi:MAG: hypothetical protein IKO33_00055 [Bacteroidaceae bacterium]|nr:hypothetical protein [Bacteroidaceae bacterium]
MGNVLAVNSSDPVGMQVLVGILSAILFGIFVSIFSKKKPSDQDDSDILLKIKRRLNSERSIDNDPVRKYVRKSFDEACVEIVLSCQNLPKKDRYVEIGLRIDRFYLNFSNKKSVKESEYDEILKMAKDNNIDWEKLLEEELKRAYDIFNDPMDYID